MSRAPRPDGPGARGDRFRVIVRREHNTVTLVEQVAESQSAAHAGVRERGEHPLIVIPSRTPPEDEQRLLHACRVGVVTPHGCPGCAYPWSGLAAGSAPVLVCPECGLALDAGCRDTLVRSAGNPDRPGVPGEGAAQVGLVVALLGCATPIMPAIAIGLASWALIASEGRRGRWALGVGIVMLAVSLLILAVM